MADRTSVQIAQDNEVTYSSSDWIILLVAVIFQIALWFIFPSFAWLALPFWFTYLVKCLHKL